MAPLIIRSAAFKLDALEKWRANESLPYAERVKKVDFAHQLGVAHQTIHAWIHNIEKIKTDKIAEDKAKKIKIVSTNITHSKHTKEFCIEAVKRWEDNAALPKIHRVVQHEFVKQFGVTVQTMSNWKHQLANQVETRVEVEDKVVSVDTSSEDTSSYIPFDAAFIKSNIDLKKIKANNSWIITYEAWLEIN